MSDQQHPNFALLQKFDPAKIAEGEVHADVFAEDVVWHYYNPRLPEMEGEYIGRAGVQKFFAAFLTLSKGSFQITPVSISAAGDELLVTHTKNRMEIGENTIEIDAVVVWRIVDGKIAEAWDIPAVGMAPHPHQENVHAGESH